MLTVVPHRSIVDSEEAALPLMDFAESNVPHIQRRINLLDASHGKVRFYRRIRFENKGQEQKDELVEMMKKSGYIPKNYDREQLVKI